MIQSSYMMKNETAGKKIEDFLLRLASNSSYMPESKNNINDNKGGVMSRTRTAGLYEKEMLARQKA